MKNNTNTTYYLAIDISPMTGRHLLGHVGERGIELEEVYRFNNRIKDNDGHLYWDVEYLFKEIKEGMKACYNQGKIPRSLSIDTWGVDYCLLDKENELIRNPFCFRDKRTAGMYDKIYTKISEDDLYERTGTLRYDYNTISQLLAHAQEFDHDLRETKTLLFLPDYLNFLLTGNIFCEYTIASTSGLLNIKTNDWDYELITKLGLPRRIFKELSNPKTFVGRLKDEIVDEVMFQCEVVLCASHDTASSVLSLPTKEENCLFINSGTFSYLGFETLRPYTDFKNRVAEFTNQGGFDFKYLYLKNIPGFYILQQVRKEMKLDMSHAEISEAARNSKVNSTINLDDERFDTLEDISKKICEVCWEKGTEAPKTIGDYAKVIFESLAEHYNKSIKAIERNIERKFESICIFGGGSNSRYLNELTAEKTGKTIIIGNPEASGLGNIMVQMLRNDYFASLEAARDFIRGEGKIY